jgi:hypothetical protein
VKFKRRTFLKITAASCVAAAGVGGGILIVNFFDQLKRLKSGFADAVVKRYGKSRRQAQVARSSIAPPPISRGLGHDVRRWQVRGVSLRR